MCILVPGRYLCALPVTTYTPPTGTPEDAPRTDCCVRFYLPEDMHGAPVVLCSELPNNPGGSITDSAAVVAAEVIRANELLTPLVWIEYLPKEGTDRGAGTSEPVVFSSYKVEERAPYLGERRAWIGDATWKPLDPASVKASVGRPHPD